MGAKNIKHSDWFLQAFQLAAKGEYAHAISSIQGVQYWRQVLPCWEPIKDKAVAWKVVAAMRR